MPNNAASSGSPYRGPARCPATQNRVTRDPSWTLDLGKDADEGLGNEHSETRETSRRRRRNEGTGGDSVEENLIARRPFHENGARIIASVEFKWPFRYGGEGAGRSEFNRINRIQLKAPSSARLDSRILSLVRRNG